MNVFIAADDNYIYPAKVMLTSFFANNPQGPHHIYFMCSALKGENLAELETLVKKNGAEFIPQKITEESFEGFVVTDRFPAEVYFRFLAAHLLPAEEERALWLDVDLIVNQSLDAFYNIDLNGKAFAACESIGDHSHILAKLGCMEHAVYINSGVLLINANQMRRYGIKEYFDYYKKHSEVIVWPDQDILNGLFENHMLILSNQKYNVQILNGRFPSREEIRALEDNASIIHFVGYYKPWHREYTNPCAVIWDRYHAKLFGKGSTYLLKRCLNRWIWRRIRLPFRAFRGELYTKSVFLRRLRNVFRKS